MTYIKQNYTDGDIFSPFVMNYMEDNVEQDLFVVHIQETSGDNYSVDTTFETVENAIKNHKLIIYMIYDDLGNIEEDYAKMSSDTSGFYISIQDANSQTRYKHYENDTVQKVQGEVF